MAAIPFCTPCKPCQQGCPCLPCPLSPEGTTLPHSVILCVLWPGPEFCVATLHLEENKAAEMCTTYGTNYVAHLTSEIPPPPPFSSLPPFSTNYSKTGEIDRFLVQVDFCTGRTFFLFSFSAISIVILTQLHGSGTSQYAYNLTLNTVCWKRATAI